MGLIDQKYLQELQNHGLYICEPFCEGHGWEFGVRIVKPSSTKGNNIPNYLTLVEDVEVDSASIVFYNWNNYWIVLAQDHAPTFGPGYFQNKWETAEEAVKDILDFFFGDPTRMQEKAKAKKGIGIGHDK